jgi:hypothetical protein
VVVFQISASASVSSPPIFWSSNAANSTIA